MSDERAGPRVAAVLEGLALQSASGALEIEGSPGGVIYLDRGDVTFASSAWCPDLATRLNAVLRPASGVRDLLASADQPDSDLGAELVQGGHISAEDLQAILRSVVLDAVMALTVPMPDESTVDGIRLMAGVSHWAASFCRLNAASVRAEAVRRAARTAAPDLARTARLELRDLTEGSAVLSREHWALACMMDGTLSARDLAWESGLALYEAAECVGELVAAGLCAPRASEAAVPERIGAKPRTVSGQGSGRVTARGVTTRARIPKAESASGVREMPRRRPGSAPAASASAASASAASAAEPGPDQAGDPDFTPVSVDSLRRVLDALRRLN
jgi:hypothetical protein